MSGNHRGGDRRTDGPGWESDRNQPDGGYPSESGGYGYEPSAGGEYDPRSGEYRTVSGGYLLTGEQAPSTTGPQGSGGPTTSYPAADYPTASYPTGGYGTDSHSTAGYPASGYTAGSGEYRTGDPAYRTGDPAGTRDTSSHTSGGYGSGSATGYSASGAAYSPQSSGSGGYGARGSDYGSTGSGDYRRPQPPPRRPSGSGYRTGGTGSHRVVRGRTGRRMPWFLLAGVVGAVGACVLAAFVLIGGTGSGEEGDAGQVGTATAGGSPTAKAELSSVPDACELLSRQIAGKLAPNADRTQADNYQSSDQQNQCVWGVYTGTNKRQLTVELRAIEGTATQTPTDVAGGTFAEERKADESGKALLAGQELTEKASLEGAGNEGYVVYSVDKGQGSGEAIANARMVNVLVTVHYSGANNGNPLGSDDAMGGATEAAKNVVDALGTR